MKRKQINLLKLIIFLLGIFFHGYGQSGRLSVISWNLPDTSFMGDTVYVSVVVQNTGATPINDSLFYLYYSTDFIGFSQVFLDTVYLTNPLNPGDTVIDIASLTISNSTFQSGDNIVIVWPYRLSGEQGDTLQDSIYVVDTLTHLSNSAVKSILYRASQKEIQINTRVPLIRCDLITLDGKTFVLPTYTQNNYQYIIKMPANLPHTMYFIKCTFQDDSVFLTPIYLNSP